MNLNHKTRRTFVPLTIADGTLAALTLAGIGRSNKARREEASTGSPQLIHLK